MRTPEEIVKELQGIVQQYLDDETDMQGASFNYEEGILLSGEDVISILKVLSPEWAPKYPNYPPLVGYKEGYMDPFDIEVGTTVTYDDGRDVVPYGVIPVNIQTIKMFARMGYIYPFTPETITE